MTNGLSSSFVGLRPYSEYTFPVVNGRKPTSASSAQSCRCSVGAKDAMRRCILAQTIRWELYPLVTEEPHAHAWLEIQAMLGLAKNTIHAYGSFFFQAEDGIRDHCVTGVQTCALPI